MTNFEKMAIQFECCGDIFAVPEIEKVMDGVVEQNISKAERSGRITKAIGVCMSGAPEAMKKLAALGAKVLGGCCGTAPEYIRALAAAVK